MKESAKTSIFVAVATALVLVTWFTRPSFQEAALNEQVGKPLFPEFTDPLAVASLEIVKYDEGKGEAQNFEVGQTSGIYSIPTHGNYPADAENQLSGAAGGLMGLKAIEVVADSQGDHSLYGVVDPTTTKAGETGVGMRVVMRDKNKNELLGLIVGKQVPDRSGLYYVRPVGKDQVYVVEAKTDKLSTKFEDWIERNFLKMSSFDIKGMEVQDYSILKMGNRLGMDPRDRFFLDCNDNDPKWVLRKSEAFNPDKQNWTAAPLAKDEELDTSKLDAMKTALDDLKIVDVARKPAGLSGNLKAKGELQLSREAANSLANYGFFLVPTGEGGAVDLVSNNGETRVQMKDGVEYILRFGGVAGMGAEKAKTEAKDKKDAKGKDAKDAEPTGPGVNRYLFVMAEFNQALIPPPALEKLPEAKPAEKVEGKKPDAKTEPAKKEEPKKAEPKKDEPKKDDKELKAERERIEKENKRKQDEYDEKVKKGKEHVQELNARFADWYYVIADDVYRKVHLSRADIVKKKEKPKDKDGEAGHDHAKDRDHDHGPGDAAAPKPGPSGELDKLKQGAP